MAKTYYQLMSNNNNTEKWVVTIGRQFGSGGREIGRLVAEKLGIEYYDKELLIEAARQSGVSEHIFEAADDDGTPVVRYHGVYHCTGKAVSL